MASTKQVINLVGGTDMEILHDGQGNYTFNVLGGGGGGVFDGGNASTTDFDSVIDGGSANG